MSIYVPTLTRQQQAMLRVRGSSRVGSRIVYKDPIYCYKSHGSGWYVPYRFGIDISNSIEHVPRFNKRDYKFTVELRDYQQDDIQEMWKMLAKGTILLNLHTGYGKTVCALWLACKTRLKTIIFHHRVNIAKQWIEACKQFTDANVVELTNSTIDQCMDADIIICSVFSGKYLSTELIDSIGTVIVDEYHMLCTPTATTAILSTHPRYIIGLTATPDRDDGLCKIMEHTVGGNDHTMTRVYSKPVDIFISPLECTIDNIINPITNMIDWSATISSLLTNPLYNDHIVKLVNDTSGKILILTNTIQHCDHLHTIIDRPSSVMRGNMKSYEDVGLLIGTYSKIGLAFDETAIAENYNGTRINTVILAGSFKNCAMLVQAVGRAFRSEHPRVIDIHINSGVFNKHFKERMKVYKRLGYNINYLE